MHFISRLVANTLQCIFIILALLNAYGLRGEKEVTSLTNLCSLSSNPPPLFGTVNFQLQVFFCISEKQVLIALHKSLSANSSLDFMNAPTEE